MLKRKRRHAASGALRSAILRDEIRHKRDFDWQPRKRNPLTGEREYGAHMRWRMYVGALIVTTTACFGLLFYHPFFHITDIELQGLQRIEESEVIDAVQGIIDKHRFMILPGQNYFLVDVDEVKDILQTKYPIADIHIEKEFPQVLHIVIEEKISTVIYDNGKQYAYLGLDGKAVEILRSIGDDEWYEVSHIVTTTLADGTVREETVVLERYHIPDVPSVVAQMGDYPIVYDRRHRDINMHEQQLLENTVHGVITWFYWIRQNTDIPISYMTIEHELGEGSIRMREGWELRVNFYGDVERQIHDLQQVLETRIKRHEIQYIDVRFEGRVYWQ